MSKLRDNNVAVRIDLIQDWRQIDFIINIQKNPEIEIPIDKLSIGLNIRIVVILNNPVITRPIEDMRKVFFNEDGLRKIKLFIRARREKIDNKPIDKAIRFICVIIGIILRYILD